jgi:hypothetical protein
MPPLPFWGFLALAIEGLKKEKYLSLKLVKGRWGSRIFRCGMVTVGEGGALPFPRIRLGAFSMGFSMPFMGVVKPVVNPR